MGGLFSRMFAKRKVRCIMIGLDNSGKTTILYRLKLGEVHKTVPTIGFNVESVKHKNVEFTVWDIGGQDRIRPLWRHYYAGVNAVVFVVDSMDNLRIEEAKDEIQLVANDDMLQGAVFLVFANKMDAPEAMPTGDVVARLNMQALRQQWFVQGSCALTGQGLYEGLDWLTQHLDK